MKTRTKAASWQPAVIRQRLVIFVFRCGSRVSAGCLDSGCRAAGETCNQFAAESNVHMLSVRKRPLTCRTAGGYGHPTPLSDAGKAFSIAYALIGVPFTMLVLTACVQRIMQPLVLAPVGLLQRAGLKPRPATVVHFLLLLLAVVLCCFLAPAAVFSALEASWTFLDSVYFCFISLCTIGLGDFVPAARPGQPYRALYQVAVMVYLFIGLMMMYLLLRTFHKMADVHGLTTFFQLPRCEASLMDDDTQPIVCNDPTPPRPKDRPATKPLDPGSQPSYNSINKG